MQYHDETTRISQWYEDPEFASAVDNETLVGRSLSFPQLHETTPGSNPSSDLDHQARINDDVTPNFEAVQPMDTSHDMLHEHDADGVKANWHATAYGGAIRPATREDGSQVGSYNSPDTTRSLSMYGMSPASMPMKSDPSPLTDREAVLMRNYAENMALWVRL